VGFYAFGPAQEDVAGRLHHPLPLHDPLARLAVLALAQMILQHRPRGFLHLQEQRVVSVAALQQDDERPGAYAADPHHLAGRIHELVPLQETATIRLQRSAVRAELLVYHPCNLVSRNTERLHEITRRYHNGWLTHDAVLAVDQLGELR